MKKIIATLLSCAIFSCGTVTAFAKATSNSEQELKDSGIKEVVSSTWYEEGKNPSLRTRSAQNILTNEEQPNTVIHNNGNPIDTNILVDKQGNELFAIYINGPNEQTYYFADTNKFDKDELLEKVEEDSTKSIPKIMTRSVNGTGSYIRNLNWTFTNPHFGNTSGTLYQSVSFTRKSSTTVINGKSGSVWDITADAQAKTKNGMHIQEQYTRLDAGYANESLISWGPSSSFMGKASVTLTGIVPAISYSFDPFTFRTTDRSDKGGKYGRWSWYTATGIYSALNTKPGVRITNTSGKVGLKVSNTLNIPGSKNHSTGVVEIFQPDR